MSPKTAAADPLLGQREIADLLDVKPATVQQWGFRARKTGTGRARPMPEHDEILSGVKLWRRSTIEKWARETNRWPGVEAALSDR